jgi:hypothetical protein
MKLLAAAIVLGMNTGLVYAAQMQAACQDSGVPLKFRSPVKDLSGELPIPDYLDAIVACNAAARPLGMPMQTSLQPTAATAPSPWLQSERELYQRVLAKRPVDVLVVPFQVQGYGLDRVERQLMSAELADAIGASGQFTVADPWLVSRAMGEGMRRIDPAEAQSLGGRLGAQKIVYGYVGHDAHHTFTLTLEVFERTTATFFQKKWQRDWRAVAFTDEQTPAFKMYDLLSEITHALPLGLTPPRQRDAGDSKQGATVIALTPKDLVTAAGQSVPPVQAFDLLGVMTSPASQLTREREFERAVAAALESGSSSNPSLKFFEAYALFGLGRRLGALALLADQKNAAASTLRALLDGDLPSAQASVARVPDGLERLLLQIPVRDLAVNYGKKVKTQPQGSQAAFGGQVQAWEPLIAARSRDDDPWADDDPMLVKTMLDAAFPEPGLDASSFVRGTAIARAETVDNLDIDLANMRHVRRAAEHITAPGCCPPHGLRPVDWDLLWLLEGRTEGRIARSLWRITALQGLPESTLDELRRYDPLLSGLPSLEAARATAAVEEAYKAPDDTRDNWLAQAQRAAAVAAYWSPGQNAVALQGLTAMGIPSPQSEFMADAYGYDYPRQAFWPPFFFGSENDREQVTAFALEALAFSSTDESPLSQLTQGNQRGQAGAVIASLGSRFSGSPRKPVPMAREDDPTDVRPEAVMRRIRIAIKADPELWENYRAMGLAIVQSGGKFADATQAFLSYPRFKDRSPDDPVAVSNYAYEAGSVLFWDGQPELAKPLFMIAADLDTGSNASISSQARLQLLDGDYVAATASYQQRAMRYPNSYSFRDFLSMLHVFGKHDVAWKAFSQVNASSSNPQVWVSALIGQRMQGLDDKAVREWLLKPEIREARFQDWHFASYYAILWNATDREPPGDLGRLVEQLDGEAPGHIDIDGQSLLVPHPLDIKSFMIVQPSGFRAGKSPKLPPGTAVKSAFAYFADAYAALRAEDYEKAVTRFLAMADRYPIEGYALPYFAYAAAKSGDHEELEKYLDGWPSAKRNFDYWLAKSFFAGTRKDAESASRSLQQAFRQRASSDNDSRPFLTEYQYAQACEWLYRDTGDARFAEELLGWVKKYEVIVPTQGWSYAVEYAYGQRGPDRTRALAMARYLDPRSPRIQSASAAEVKAADAWYQAHNPFRLPNSDSDAPHKVATR